MNYIEKKKATISNKKIYIQKKNRLSTWLYLIN
jgi:hypothetical protein